MSADSAAAPAAAAAAAVAEGVAPAPLDPQTALREVVKKALAHDGVRRGLREAVRALDRGVARLCITAGDCDEANYKKLIKALCKEFNVKIIEVPKRLELGEIVGQAKRRADGTSRKAVRCSCAVITDFGEDSPALNVLLEHVRSQ
jgi:small subunit ribosomal protein S12e